jgi:DNA-binding PadR family transcriptional regulator
VTDKTPEDLVPLKPAWLHILLALAEEPQHGYAIRAHAEQQSNGRVKLWPVTLYGSLRDMEDGGLVRPLDEAASADADARRQYYDLTAFGRQVLRAETDRLQELVDAARASRALGEA